MPNRIQNFFCLQLSTVIFLFFRSDLVYNTCVYNLFCRTIVTVNTTLQGTFE